ncbi:MAG: hypothetical protein K1X78_00860 [Verrucomicrobiaceae bacterium]|nr:hypothetical protein [Verrucomicrobiaceae bacterium]
MLTDQVIDPNQQKKPHVLVRPFLAIWHWMVPPSQAHMDRQSRTAVAVRSAVVIGAALAIVGTGLFWGRDLRDYYKTWRSNSLVKQARELADSGNFLNAVLKAQEAYSIAPENTEAIRQNAEFLTKMRRQEAVYFSDLLDKQGKATAQDVQTKVRALMNLNRTKEASDTLNKLMRNSPPTDSIFKLAEDVWGGTKQSEVVLTVLKEYCAKHPTDNESLLRLAKFQVAAPSSKEFASGMESLWKLADNPGDMGIRAIEVLDAMKGLSPEESKRLVGLLTSHPRATPWHEVAALKRRIAMSPTRRAQIVQEAVLKYQQARREDRVPFVRWLVLEREFLQVVALVDEIDAKQNRDLLENYLTALTMLGRFDDLAKLVEDIKVVEILNKTVRAFYRAHLAFVTGKPKDEVREKLLTAKLSAQDEGRGDMLLTIATYAEKRGIMDVAEDSFRAASLSRRVEREGFDGLMRLCQFSGKLSDFLEASREAVRRWPDDENLLERHLYGNLIAGNDVELSLERTLALLAKRPDDSSVKLAAAVGYYWFGDIDMVTNHMQHVDLNKCTVGQQAVFAWFAHAGGFNDEANTVLKSIPPSAKMFPQEAMFLTRVKQAVTPRS